MSDARDRLLGQLLRDRGVVADGDLQRAYAQAGQLRHQGAAVSLGQVLVQAHLVDAIYWQTVEMEINESGRGCARCQQVFLKPPMAPELCPSCQVPLQGLPNGGAPPTSFNPVSGYPPQAMPPQGMPPQGMPQPSGVYNMGPGSGIHPSLVSGQMTSQHAAYLSGQFRMPLNGFIPPETTAASTPAPASRVESGAGETRSGKDNGLSPGATFANHEILKELGRGGMGVVYKARNLQTNEVVALKVLLNGEFASEKIKRRFEDEIEVLRTLDHPGIVPIRNSGVEGNLPYFTMAFIDGGGLDELIKARKLPLRRGVEIVAEVARAIHEAHCNDIIHRDLKPANIMVDKSNTPFIMDFGLAKNLDANHGMTRSGVPIGTPYYMPPEQARGEHRDIDARADIYALGAVLYEIIAHRVPFKASSTTELVRMIIEDEPTPPRQHRRSCPPEFEAITLKCLRKDRDERYETSLDLAEDLEAALAGRPIRAAASLGETLRRNVKRHKRSLLLSVGAALLLAVFGVGGALLIRAQNEAERLEQERREREEAQRKKDEEEKLQREKEERERKERERLAALEQQAQAAEREREARLDSQRRAIRQELERSRRIKSVKEWRPYVVKARGLVDELFAAAGEAASGEDFYLRATILEALGELSAAREDYQRAAATPGHRARGHLALGRIAFFLERDRDAAVRAWSAATLASEAPSPDPEEREAAQIAAAAAQVARVGLLAIQDGLRDLPRASTLPINGTLRGYLLVSGAPNQAAENLAKFLEEGERALRDSHEQDPYDYANLCVFALCELRRATLLKDKGSQARFINTARQLLSRAQLINDKLPGAFEVLAVLELASGNRELALRAVEAGLKRATTPQMRADLSTIKEEIASAPNLPSFREFAIQIPTGEEQVETPTVPRLYSVSNLNFSLKFEDEVEERCAPLLKTVLESFSKKAHQAGLDATEKLLKIVPDHFKLNVLYGHLLLELDRNEEALTHFQALLGAYPEHPWVCKFIARTLRAEKRYAEAIAPLETALKTLPKDVEALFLVTECYQKTDQWDEVLERSTRALAVDENNPYFLERIARAHIHKGEDAKALPFAEAAWKQQASVPYFITLLVALTLNDRIGPDDGPVIQALLEKLGNSEALIFVGAMFQLRHGDASRGRALLERLNTEDAAGYIRRAAAALPKDGR